MNKIAGLHIVFVLMAASLYAQVPDSTVTDTTRNEVLPPDSLLNLQRDTLCNMEPEEHEQITPWREKVPVSAYTITNDSLLRWQVWPNWGDFQAYRRDVISFRQGTSARTDAFHINGYEPHEQQLQMEGISLNNPLTGLPNYSLVPHRKIGVATESYGGNYHSDIRLRDYYILKPISYLNYDEASGHYRNLEFMVSQNFTARTNLELSYWDRRSGGYYPNNETEGSQVIGRVYHHLSDRFLIRGLYLRNQLTNDEPFGYVVNNPTEFIFDEFSSPPLSSNGNSKLTRWDLAGGIYHRKDTSSSEDAGFEAVLTKNKKNLRFSGDTLSWDIRTLSGKLFKTLNWQGFNFRAELHAEHHSANDIAPVSETNWFTSDALISASYPVAKYLRLYGKGIWKNRNDNKTGYEFTGGIKAHFSERLKAGLNASVFNQIPTMQALYWNSSSYLGNPDLENEFGVSFFGKLDFKLIWNLTFGASGRYKAAENATFLTQDGTFSNSGYFEHLAGAVYGRFENHRFEFESSGILQMFNYEDVTSPDALFNNQDQIIWLRNSAFVKGYVFDRAAFLKIGVKALLSPFYYDARTYNTELGYWQGNSTYQQLPPFMRLDGELSARVRRIMVVMRWENALDGLGQAGYFEATGFPMPPRRLIVGIRAQFRN